MMRKILLIVFIGLLLASCHAGWIDLDTPFDKRTTQSLVDQSIYYLVSDNNNPTP